MPTIVVSPFATRPLIVGGRREPRIRSFAAANGLVYDRGCQGAPATGALFGLGHEHRTLRRFRGLREGRRFEVGNFALRTQPGRRLSEVVTGYLVLGPLPGPETAERASWCRLAAPAALTTAHVESCGCTVVAHTLDPFDFARPSTWELIAELAGELAR